MEELKGITYGAVFAVIIMFGIGYSLGFSAGEEQVPSNQYTDEEFYAMQACYEAAVADKNEVSDIADSVGYDPEYQELSDAIFAIRDIVSGKVISVPKIKGDRKSGYYDCE